MPSATMGPENMEKNRRKNLHIRYSSAYLPGCTSGLVAWEYSFSSLEDHWMVSG